MERAIDAGDWDKVAAVLEAEGNIALQGIEQLVNTCLVNGCPIGTLDLLVRNGADCNEENAKGDSPLMIAVFHKKTLEFIRLLIEEASVVDADPKLVRYLISKGADVNSSNQFGNTPLFVCAVENRSGGLATVLIESGADVTAVDQNGNTCLVLASERNCSTELLIALLAKSDVNAQNAHGNHALGLACWKGCRVSVVELLLNNGAKILLRNHDSRTPHQLAKDGRSASQELLEVLQRAEAEAIHQAAEMVVKRFSHLDLPIQATEVMTTVVGEGEDSAE
ncbi:hypothetical protein BASA81_012840 [Batrachochytrium salamandrivorans]|nr:hypothetical protein BASA81_012840 [Batrachochytrium salamandrivorans]